MERYEYIHGGNIYGENGRADQKLIDFSTNINPLGMPENVISAAKQAIEHAGIYPDSACRRLTHELAKFESVGEKSVLCAGGASDIIFRAVYAVKPKKILVTAPSFADYERAGRAAGAEIIFYPLNKESGFAITQDIVTVIFEVLPDMVFICNPNNPTGILTGIDTIGEIAKACRAINSVLIVDECFLDFVPDSQKYSARELLNKYHNVMVVKAFTKIFAMPGLRLGYAICDNEMLLDRMRFCGADWPVSNVAQAAGLAALTNGRDYIRRSVKYIHLEREHMMDELSRMGFVTYESCANFIFFYCDWDVDLNNTLYNSGILIRDCRNFAGLEPGYYRIAVSTSEKNTQLIKTMRGEKFLWQRQL